MDPSIYSFIPRNIDSQKFELVTADFELELVLPVLQLPHDWYILGGSACDGHLSPSYNLDVLWKS